MPTFLNHLNKVKCCGKNKWTACCPCHIDKTPSLSIKLLDDGRYIMHCFGCGANGQAVIGTLGLSMSEICGDSLPDPTKIPREVKEKYIEDKLVMAIYKEDKKKGITHSYRDMKRKRLAEARIKGVEAKWGVFN